MRYVKITIPDDLSDDDLRAFMGNLEAEPWFHPCEITLEKAEVDVEMFRALGAAYVSMIGDEYYQEFKPVIKTVLAAIEHKERVEKEGKMKEVRVG